ncbi:MAG: TROVE domain-containing protein [Dehalococcoidia bacterium]
MAGWYGQPARRLALQAVKYQQRDGWSHRDPLRLAHPAAGHADTSISSTGSPAAGRVGDEPHPDATLRLLWALERVKRAGSVAEVVRPIREQRGCRARRFRAAGCASRPCGRRCWKRCR